MDASGDSTHHGNGNGSSKSDHPDTASLPSAAGPSGAPVESPKVDASAGAPEPLVVIDRDPPKRTKLTPNQVAFLQALAAEAGNVSAASRACGQSRRNHQRWMAAVDETGLPTPNALAYQELVAEIEDESLDEVEAEIRRRAIQGVDEPQFYQGSICGYVRKFSDVLLIFRAKALAPHKYRERHEITGAGGKPLNPEKVTVDVRVSYEEALATLTDEELEQHNAILAKLHARTGGTPPPGAN